jgi:glutathione S-transferase
MLRILGRRTSSNVQKVMWCLAELAFPFEQENYGGQYGKTRDPHYLRMNPNGTVPTIIDDDLVLWESNTILRYLCNKCDAGALYPQGIAQRALVERWMDWQLGCVSGPFGTLYRGLVREQRCRTELEPVREAMARHFAVLEAALDGLSFIAGDELTLADIALGPTAYRWLNMDIERDDAPNLQAWHERLALRSAFREYVMIGLH